MRSLRVLALSSFAAALAAWGFPATSQSSDQNTGPAGQVQSSGDAQHGEYLVHNVAMCVQCHSARNLQGELIQESLFLGGSIPVKSPFSGPRWAFQAPNLRSVPGYTEEQFVKLLTTGVRPAGDRPRSPMPPFRLTTDDARAIYAYLKALR